MKVGLLIMPFYIHSVLARQLYKQLIASSHVPDVRENSTLHFVNVNFRSLITDVSFHWLVSNCLTLTAFL